MLDFARLPYWKMVEPGLCPVYPYSVPGIAIELVKTGPKWRTQVPKDLGPLLEEVIFDRLWAHVGLHNSLKTLQKLGLKRAKAAEKGSTQAQNGPKRSV